MEGSVSPSGGVLRSVGSVLAYTSYLALSGEGRLLGDGALTWNE